MATGAGTGTSSTAVEALRQVERLGRYQVVARLGQGGMGTIHLAVAGGLADFRKLLVVKELRRELTANERFVEMFLAEAKLAARLDHPNIVQTLEAGQDGDRYFLAMEFLDGQPLVEILKRVDDARTVPTCLLIQILCDVLAGLHYAHELCDYDETPLHIVHRDVNPQNVFVTYHGHVKLVDFGIAKVIDSEMCTTAGVFKGKFPYAAPEQVSCQPVDRRADVFAVGVMLWEILAQKRFAPGHPTTQSIDARLAGSEPRISALRPDVDPELAAICDHAMHVDPELRYRSAEEFRVDLLDFLASRTEMAPPLSLGELMKREFGAERTAAHRVIGTQIRKVMPDEDLGDSLVRVLTRSSSPPGFAAANVSQHDTAPARPSGIRRPDPMLIASNEHTSPSLRRGHAGWRETAISLAAVLAFGAAYLFVRSGSDSGAAPEPGATADRAASPAANSVAAVNAAADSARSGSTTSAATYRDPLPVGRQEPAPSAAASTTDREPGRTLAAGTPQPGGRLLRRADGVLEPAGASARSRSRRRRDATNVAIPEEPKAPVALRAVERRSPPQAAPTPKAPAARSSALTVGDDLRVLRGQRRTRTVSLEDPFQ